MLKARDRSWDPKHLYAKHHGHTHAQSRQGVKISRLRWAFHVCRARNAPPSKDIKLCALRMMHQYAPNENAIEQVHITYPGPKESVCLRGPF